MNETLTIGLDARLREGTAGGIEQVVIGLAHGLSQLTDGDQRYLFLTYKGQDQWLRPYLSGPCATLPCEGPPASRWRRKVHRLVNQPKRWLQKLRFDSRHRHVPASDGVIEKAGVDLMHFTFQSGFRTEVPSIYHPHDLQHIHLPHFFSERRRTIRDAQYRALCNQASMVGVTSSWIQQDLIHQYQLPEDKVRVVPWAPILGAYPTPAREDLAAIRQKHDLPELFFFYPAQTWAHKNHAKLFDALDILRRRDGIRIPFVFCGRMGKNYSMLAEKARQLDLTSQMRFVGFVSPMELQCLYKLCRALVIPTKFEAASFPLWEGFQAGTAVACSNVTSLPEQAGDAALVFDPDNAEEMADAMKQLWSDATLRKQLIELGSRQVSRFSWAKTARMFRAHYRRLASRTMTSEDKQLLNAAPGI